MLPLPLTATTTRRVNGKPTDRRGQIAQLTEKGVSSATLRPGDKIVITGHPGRVAENHRLQLMKVERPSDGFKWEGNIQ